MGRTADNPTPHWDANLGCWTVRVTKPRPPGWPAGKPAPRVLVKLQTETTKIGEHERERAERFAKLAVKNVRAGGAGAPEEDGETVEDFAERWLKSRVGRVASVRDNKAHLECHILPVIGRHPIVSVTSKEIEDVVTALDRKVRAGDMNAKTARNAWGTCSKLFDDATHAKPATGLRCLTVDPTQGVRGPDDDDADKALQFLYPSEFSAFVACEDVPLKWRKNVAVAVYLCLRDGEHRALKWPSVDLAHGVVTVAETFDRRAGADREGTKSGAARVVPIRPELLPLLTAMREESGGKGLVCELPSLRDMARGLRRWLLRAGVDRPQLHEGSTVSKQMRWHDLRATGLTWYAVQGRPATEIRDIAGHAQTSMTDRYMRSAGILRGGRFGGVFPALPADMTKPRTGADCCEVATIAPTPGTPDDDEPAVSQPLPLASGDNSAHFLSSSSPVRPAEFSIDSPESLATKPEKSHNPPASPDPVEAALAVALTGATAAGQWAIVAQLAGELEARRRARADVATLADARTRRGR